jgi:hypothetical protein
LGQQALGKIESVLNVIELGGPAGVFNVAAQSVNLAAQLVDLFTKLAQGACGADRSGTANPLDGRGDHKYEHRKAGCQAAMMMSAWDNGKVGSPPAVSGCPSHYRGRGPEVSRRMAI